jgi:hypothetical protein
MGLENLLVYDFIRSCDLVSSRLRREKSGRDDEHLLLLAQNIEKCSFNRDAIHSFRHEYLSNYNDQTVIAEKQKHLSNENNISHRRLTQIKKTRDTNQHRPFNNSPNTRFSKTNPSVRCSSSDSMCH